MERAILESADLLERGDYAPVEDKIKAAVGISLTRDMGTDYFEDPKGRLEHLKELQRSNQHRVGHLWTRNCLVDLTEVNLIFLQVDQVQVKVCSYRILQSIGPLLD
jgi:hypothetical protein